MSGLGQGHHCSFDRENSPRTGFRRELSEDRPLLKHRCRDHDPGQHGESLSFPDGGESLTLDLGNYERFLDIDPRHAITSLQGRSTGVYREGEEGGLSRRKQSRNFIPQVTPIGDIGPCIPVAAEEGITGEGSA